MANLSCPYCHKPYVNKAAFRRHILLCGDAIDPEESPPPASQVYKMLVELTRQHHELQARFEALKRQIPTKTRRIGLVEWLKRTQTQCVTYEAWKDKFQITREDLELVFRVGYKRGVTQLLEDRLPAGGLGECAPIRSFTQYPSVLFVNAAKGGWRPGSLDDVKALVAGITRLLSAELSDWQADNRERMQNERFIAEFPKKVRVATGSEVPLHVAASYVKSRLCLYLRCQACTIIECEVAGEDINTRTPCSGEGGLKSNATHAGV